MLESLDQRSRLQLRMQQTVEGLSVVAISYYVVGILNYAIEAANVAELLNGLSVALVTGCSVPAVVLSVWGLMRYTRYKIMNIHESNNNNNINTEKKTKQQH